MNKTTKLTALLAGLVLAAAACSSSGASSAPAGAPSGGASTAAGDPNDLLAKIKAAGVIKVGTDPAYPPQSELKTDGTYEGFDIDVANEIGKRLGVKVEFDDAGVATSSRPARGPAAATSASVR